MNWLIAAGLLLTLFAVILIARFLPLWIQARLTGTRIGLVTLMTMPLRRVSPTSVVRCKVMAVQAGVSPFSTAAVEAQYLAGGDSQAVVFAMIAAHRAGIELDWDTAAAIDLAGRDVVDAIQLSVNPRVINCPDTAEGRSFLIGVSKDGIQLQVRVRVTVRTNMTKLIGGATEQTIIARVGQGVVSAVGGCDTYLDAIGDPMVITREVLDKCLDAGTAFEIVSIDIADIDVADNIGARLQSEQAEADIRIARAAAAQRLAVAMAKKQEQVAEIAAQRAKLVLAEAGIPSALSTAFRGSGMENAQIKAGQSEISWQIPMDRKPQSRFVW